MDRHCNEQPLRRRSEDVLRMENNNNKELDFFFFSFFTFASAAAERGRGLTETKAIATILPATHQQRQSADCSFVPSHPTVLAIERKKRGPHLCRRVS